MEANKNVDDEAIRSTATKLSKSSPQSKVLADLLHFASRMLISPLVM